ncbi:histidine phosphatase family protein [Pisciglobus halotolerans]|uniref:Probable phosphoglycerate mutase n=1 Tax=Pisciglobus halotolerans TaxID=745365 RepID=A0A1I3AVT5_9LACT|nr:histidine phosphatase family protein [Pisciglobus halotolerans]SFH54060.1 probable phosphoglycerate mutase [Pisciglobus halotolerans]
MQRLFFVRHGKTTLNLAHHVQGGAIDSPLLDESREEAVKTGEALAPFNISQVIASPQHRAVETAELITKQFPHPFDIHFSNDFKEMDYGTWEGLPIAELSKRDAELFEHLIRRPEKYDPTPIQGETYQQLVTRGKRTVEQAIAAFPDTDILFVGHAILTMCTLLSLLGKDVKDFRSFEPLDNTSVTILNYQHRQFSLNVWNQTDHLR